MTQAPGERPRPAATASVDYDRGCTRCPRLSAHLDSIRRAHGDYFNAPVPAFGDPEARLLIVGLAPGLHGANATGRPFTGDSAGVLLYRTLYELGLSNREESLAPDDGLELSGCRITNAVKCLPPQNRPTAVEVRTCNRYLRAEIAALPNRSVILSLGGIAHGAVLRARGLKLGAHAFGHGRVHRLSKALELVNSYHCSRYNTQTGRLTAAMFRQAVVLAKGLAEV